MAVAGKRARRSRPTVRRPGTAVLLSAELGRYTVAQQCFDALELPPGTTRLRHAGRSNVADNRNAIAESFTGDWLAMIDDDHVYLPDMLQRLLRHLDNPKVDIVTPLIVRRTLPHQNVLVSASADPAKPHETRQIVLNHTDQGLREVEAAGTGVMLLRRRVFDRVGRPWFEWGRTSEDFALCLKARAAGCGIYCDLDTRVGHLLPMIVWPARAADGRFVPMYSHFASAGTAAVTLEAIKRNHDETDLRPKPPSGSRTRHRVARKSR
jgi:glycosyltransferase involved in cell wall biosynthesis